MIREELQGYGVCLSCEIIDPINNFTKKQAFGKTVLICPICKKPSVHSAIGVRWCNNCTHRPAIADSRCRACALPNRQTFKKAA